MSNTAQILVPMSFKLRGRYKIETVDKWTGKARSTGWFDNLVLNNGLDMVGNGNNAFAVCCVGSGNTTPAVTQTALASLVASTTTKLGAATSSNTGTSPYIGSTSFVYQFAAGVATGNLSEVGVGATTTSLFSRALITDGSGSPTTITVLSSEALNVTYEVQVIVPLTDVTGTVTISGVSYAWTARAAQAASTSLWCLSVNWDTPGFSGPGEVYNGSIGAITGSPSGTAAALASAGSTSVGTYTTGSYVINTTYNSALSDANVSGGITAIAINAGRARNSFGGYQIGFSPAIPKTSSYTMQLVFQLAWSA